MALDAESFRGKLYLLIIDKLAIGAVIAGAFVAYDFWKTASDRAYTSAATKVQLEFERAKLGRELIPVLADPEANVVTKAYLLRSAIATGSIDAEAGVELGRTLIPAGLEDSHFERVMAAAMPQGIPAVSRHAAEMAQRWRKSQGGAFWPSAAFNPESGRENVPQDIEAQIHEARLWRSVLLAAVPTVDASYTPLQDDGGLAKNIFGLFVLLNPGDQFEAVALSRSASRGISLIGHVSRLLFDARDEEAARAVGNVWSSANPTSDSIALSAAVMRILLEYGPPHGGPTAESLARVLTHEPLSTDDASVRTAFYWLQWQSADLLDAMADVPEVHAARDMLKINPNAPPDGWIGVNPAKETLLAYLTRFTASLQEASDEATLDRLARRYESGELVRRVVSLLGTFDSPDVRAALTTLGLLSEERFRYFPFLKEDVDRAANGT
jgi:hypothetical protein